MIVRVCRIEHNPLPAVALNISYIKRLLSSLIVPPKRIFSTITPTDEITWFSGKLILSTSLSKQVTTGKSSLQGPTTNMNRQITSNRNQDAWLTKPQQFWKFILGACIFFLALLIRYRLRRWTNIDTDTIESWYKFLFRRGIDGLANGSFSNYPPAYLYCLWLVTRLSQWVGPLSSIKLIPTFFDLVSTLSVYLLARTKHDQASAFLLAGVFFTLPTVMMNSTGWGQIDSAYTAFLLLSLYFLYIEKPFWGLLAFGVAFSFKLQAIFLLPFLGILLFWGKVRWYHFLLIPVDFVILAIPALMIGRDWSSILYLYFGQLEQFENLARNAPNPYIFISSKYYHPVLEIGLAIFAAASLSWAWINWKWRMIFTSRKYFLTALTSVALVPFLLPKMHERYFYPADAISFVTAIFIPQLWFVPVLFQISSGLTYTIFLLGWDPMFVKIAAFINTGLVAVIAYKQIQSINDSP